MTRLISMVLLLSFASLTSTIAQAQQTEQTLFAVDLALNTTSKNAAYDVIRELTLNAPTNHSVGLTLFDDTVRRYVKPAALQPAQIRLITDSTDALQSLRGSSNLAVGIERAIDNHGTKMNANLIVFTRGVIDTPTDDPRAKFSEWLEVILLPQALESGITITLVVPPGSIIAPSLKAELASSTLHTLETFRPGTTLPASVIAKLGIADRPYGEMPIKVAANNNAPGIPSQKYNTAQPQTAPVTEQKDLQPTQTILPKPTLWLIAKIALLILTLILTYVLFRLSRKNHSSRSSEPEINTRSTYLPLNEKPSNTMDSWLDIDNDDATGPRNSRDTKTRKMPTSNSQNNSMLDEKNPWD